MKIVISILLLLYAQSEQYLYAQCIDSSRIDLNRKLITCDPKISEIKPICGCDSLTYLNTNCALSSGILFGNIEGGCRCIDTTVIDKNYSDSLNPYITPSILCGCDGNTYRDPYVAYLKYGITKFIPGNGCKCIDSSFIDESSFIKHSAIEKSSSKGCKYDSSKPVCGCDSVTYLSELEAIYKYGITKFRNGKCKCLDTTMININIECDSVYNPVCGCDNVTYKNSCVAQYHFGIKDFKPGVCPCYDKNLFFPNADCPNDVTRPKYVCGCDSLTYLNICQATCQYNVLNILHTGVCRCPDYKIINLNVICQGKYEPVCGCDGKTYKNICEAESLHGIWAIDRGHPCKCNDLNMKNDDINCYPELLFDPVCGCDSVTYPNECTALYKFGITSWKNGPCNYYCKDISHIDSSRFCSDIYMPVCGCDNKTYVNECQAYYKNGITKWKTGHCDSLTSISRYVSNSLIIYPNPTSSVLFVHDIKSVTTTKILLRLLDLNGNILFVREYKNLQEEIQIPVQNFSCGIYIINIIDSKGNIWVEKFNKI